MFTADQIVAHMLGDYLLQSHAMATKKTAKTLWCLAHVATYSIPFMFLKPSLAALAVIVGTHFVIDRWRLARFVCWFKTTCSAAA